MTINTKELIDAVSVVAENHNIRLTVKSSLKSSALVGATTFVGAILLGPIGILVGSLAGGITSYSLSKGTFKSAAVIIRDELTDEQREKLCQHITEAFRNFGPQDISLLIPLLATNASLQKIILTNLVQFLTNELKMKIID